MNSIKLDPACISGLSFLKEQEKKGDKTYFKTFKSNDSFKTIIL